MKYLLTALVTAFFLGLVTSAPASAVICLGGQQGGSQIDRCDYVSRGTGAIGYCGMFKNGGTYCSCPSGETNDCSCSIGEVITGCTTVGSPVGACYCSTGGGECTFDGGTCTSGTYTGTCGCSYAGGSCSETTGTRTFGCSSVGSPTSPPQPTDPPGPTDPLFPTHTPVPPTNTPVPPTNTPIPPTATPTPTPTSTPTPVIVGGIYYDNDDGTIQAVGGMCTRIGLAPTPQIVANAAISATKASSGVVSPGTILGSTFSIVSNLVKGATDYRVSLALPTPAPGQAVAYTCGCPTTAGQEYLCEYSGVSADGTVNFFVKENNLADPWWQTVGGNIYARYQVQSKVPVATCDTDPDCESGIITSTSGSNYGGFITVGDTGVVRTDKDGSDAYVHSGGSRTTALGAYAVGVAPSAENYDFFYGNVSRQLTTVSSLSDLNTKIAAQTPDVAGLYLYNSGNLVIDKSDASVPLAIPADKKAIVFVPNELQLTNSSGLDAPRLTTVANGGFLMFVVRGNITVDAAVGHISNTVIPSAATTNLEGVFMTDSQFTVNSDNIATTIDRKFIGAGTFVALDTNATGNGINLLRNYDDGLLGKTINSITPSEVFIFRPDFVDNYPTEMKTAQYNWKELAPQR